MQTSALPQGQLPEAMPASGQQVQPWHSAEDIPARKMVSDLIYGVFLKRKPEVLAAYNNRLGDFVKRLEEALYRAAKSKDEYSDSNTLEARLQDVARSLVKVEKPGAVGSSGQLNGAMAHSPGMSGQTMAGGAGMGAHGMLGGPQVQQGHYAASGMPGMMPQHDYGPGIAPEVKVEGATGIISMEPTSNGLAAAGAGVEAGSSAPGSYQHPLGSAVMSNGAPVLLRNSGARDWPAAPGAGMLSVGPSAAPPGAMGNGVPSGSGAAASAPPPGASFVPGPALGGLPASQQPLGSGHGHGPAGGSPTSMSMPPGQVPQSAAPGRLPALGGASMVPVAHTMPNPSSLPAGAAAAGASAPPGAASTATTQEAATAHYTDEQRQQYVQKQQRWLLFLRHCAKCRAADNECQLRDQCRFGKQLWSHILACNETRCSFPRCGTSKELLKHHQKCTEPSCAICAPVKDYVRKTRTGSAGNGNGTGNGQHNGGGGGGTSATSVMGPGGMAGGGGGGGVPMNGGAAANGGYPFGMVPQQQMGGGMVPVPGGPGATMGGGMMHGGGGSSGSGGHMGSRSGHKRGGSGGGGMYMTNNPAMMGGAGGSGGGMLQGGPGSGSGSGHLAMAPYGHPLRQQSGQQPMGGPGSVSLAQQEAYNKRLRLDKKAILGQNTGTSLLETFCLADIQTHIQQIKGQSAAMRASAPPPGLLQLGPEDLCRVCSMNKLTFEPPCIYCSHCGQRIKRGQTFYCTPDHMPEMGKVCYCHACYSGHGEKLAGLEGAQLRRSDLQKRKNDDEVEEYWVACDVCEAWVHQICGMFNKGRNNDDVHYLCPYCLAEGLGSGVRSPIEVRPQSMLEGKELQPCNLSNFLEMRLNKALEHEARERRATARPGEALPTADPLTIRVINSVMKRAEVKPCFAEAFRESHGYPREFPYRQKVVLLFQKQDGVDVCLFCMYVQEYGADCPAPNTNCVYLSYLDSVKYFRPEVAAASACCGGKEGVSLRTFVYHQVLQGYLTYTKMLGYQQMYIWACPPLQGDDYILYCHPAKQKTPRSDRLRHWYLDMLRQSKAEGVVVHITTLWDTYFAGGRDHRLERCSAVAIPYLEGDYWPGEAEAILSAWRQGEADGSGPGGSKASKPKGGSGAGGSGAGGGRKGAKGKRGGEGASADEALMGRLGDILGGNMREDFIVVHMREPCSFCRTHILSGLVYKLAQPISGGGRRDRGGAGGDAKSFEGIRLGGEGASHVAGPSGPISHLQLCEACYQEEGLRQAEGAGRRLPAGMSLSELVPVEVEDVAANRDPDPDMPSEIFDTRQAFLSLCQGNHYQFDTLRRAKHSSMMVLYHLHNPTAPAFTTTCNTCGVEIEPGAGFRCTVCPDFDMCASCKAGSRHEHAMVAHTRKFDETRTRLTEEERLQRAEQLRRTMALLVHSCSCPGECSSTSCRKIKQLFAHAMACAVKVTGGCPMCKKMWALLNLHAKQCEQSDCVVPRCRELKELRRRQTARKEQQRRAAYHTMLSKQHGGPGGAGG